MKFAFTLLITIVLCIGCGGNEPPTNQTKESPSTEKTTEAKTTKKKTLRDEEVLKNKQAKREEAIKKHPAADPTILGELIGKAFCTCKSEYQQDRTKVNICYRKATVAKNLNDQLYQYTPNQMKSYHTRRLETMKACMGSN